MAIRAEIQWLACRSVGVRLGKGESLADILASSSQVAEGVATAGVVVGLGRTYRVSLPVLTAVAQVPNIGAPAVFLICVSYPSNSVLCIAPDDASALLQVLDGALSPKEAVYEIMSLPQIEEH